jgi:CTP synthase
MPSMPYLRFVAAAFGCLDKVTADVLAKEGIVGNAHAVNGVRISILDFVGAGQSSVLRQLV